MKKTSLYAFGFVIFLILLICGLFVFNVRKMEAGKIVDTIEKININIGSRVLLGKQKPILENTVEEQQLDKTQPSNTQKPIKTLPVDPEQTVPNNQLEYDDTQFTFPTDRQNQEGLYTN
jgi:hypothetical protein